MKYRSSITKFDIAIEGITPEVYSRWLQRSLIDIVPPYIEVSDVIHSGDSWLKEPNNDKPWYRVDIGGVAGCLT